MNFSPTASNHLQIQSTPALTYLNWKQRPPKLNDQLKLNFWCLQIMQKSQWSMYNGCKNYRLANVNEHLLLFSTIKKGMLQGKKIFYVMDIGAGDFTWGRGVADYLNKKIELQKKNIEVHIYSLRGEANSPFLSSTGICKIKEIGECQIEQLSQALKEQGLDRSIKFDFIISRWTFRHLTDPVGTFLQAYHWLCPETGFFLLDGFFFLTDQSSTPYSNFYFNKNMVQLLIDCDQHQHFFMTNYAENDSLNHFVIQKTNDECGKNVPLNYQATYKSKKLKREKNEDWQIQSHIITLFERVLPQDENAIQFKVEASFQEFLFGDRALYESLQQENIFLLDHV